MRKASATRQAARTSRRQERRKDSARTAPLRAVAEFLAGSTAVFRTAGTGTWLTRRGIALGTRTLRRIARGPLAVAHGKHDLEFVELVPLLVGHAEQVIASPPRDGEADERAGRVLVKPERQGGRPLRFG